ncbi:hypothetical protein ROA7450_01413 [Roseovarius albus]|uniref:Uncharacterized protein n=1 Tax=Roseovarius albus TaxID=1247867 RepID=A0A1X6YU78_9RHOB|nr:hypothetical protein [Roseovarius albus]SLN31639.1 hypothetical protein ROA7450_01413 [Roseovarius albus]
MRFKRISTAALCAALAFSTVTAAPVQAHDDGVGDFIAGVALGVLGSAVAKAQHKNGGAFTPHPNLTTEENAIGLCMHRTHKAMSNQGYHHVDFEQTLSYVADVEGFTVITLEVGRSSNTNYDARSYIKVRCAIKDGNVERFHYTNYAG